ncbi:MAG: hypothetical protein ABR978_07695 [Dehalococcoidia bacterium]|jgi:hypothetical protein
MRRLLIIALGAVLLVGCDSGAIVLHLAGGNISEADYREGVDLALQSPAARSGDFVVCGQLRGLSASNAIPGQDSDMCGWIRMPGQGETAGGDRAGQAETNTDSVTAQSIIDQECARFFK